MKKYNLINLRNGQMLLSSISYRNWGEIQDEYEDYMTSLSFESILELVEYLHIEYNQLDKSIMKQIDQISNNETIEFKI